MPSFQWGMGEWVISSLKIANDHKIAFICRRLNTKILVEQETTVTDRKMCDLKALIKRKNKCPKSWISQKMSDC